MNLRIRIYLINALCLLAAFPKGAHGQTSGAVPILSRVITIRLQKSSLSQALDSIAGRGGFEFSYNSAILKGDSLVSISFRQTSIGQILKVLLGARYSYTERGHFLIILHPDEERPPPENIYQLTGYVVDRQTGKKIANASVYEKEQLQSTLTDDQGFFRLRLKSRFPYPVISVSKEWYSDTSFPILPGFDLTLSINISPVPVRELSPVYISPSKLERTRWGRWLLSSKQRMQTLNLSQFFTNKPYQLSLVPGLGTHGAMSGQIINKFSLNVLGGYTAGSRGVELGGVFNMDKQDVRYLQAAGVFNLVGRKVTGVQAAGLENMTLDTVTGVQIAGVVNMARIGMMGVQASGMVNRVIGFVRGVQVAGLANSVKRINDTAGNVEGVQVAGIGNKIRDTLKGVQISVFYNRASVVKGLQIGFVNVSDTSQGCSIGLLNIARHGGYYDLSLSAEDLTGLNLTLKTGREKLYSILEAGYNPWYTQRLYSIGYGIGGNFPLKGNLGISTTLVFSGLFDEHWNSMGLLYRYALPLTWKLNKWMSLYAGPTFSIHTYNPMTPSGESKPVIPGNGYPSIIWGNHAAAWVGASFGISFHLR